METNIFKEVRTWLGVSFFMLLFFKLGQIGQPAEWSWWWIYAPLWLPAGLLVNWFILYMLIIRPKLNARREKMVNDLIEKMKAQKIDQATIDTFVKNMKHATNKQKGE